MLNIAAYTGGAACPSAQYRVRQLVEPLRRCGVAITEYPARYGSWPPDPRLLRLPWGTAALVERTLAARRGRSADVTLLQREMLSTLFTAERFTRRPRVLDVDDAIWLLSASTAERLARSVDLVVCGNEYLHARFAAWSRNVKVIPTAVDVSRFHPASTPRSGAPLVIGWSGTSSGHKYLAAIEPALRQVLLSNRAATVRIISDRPVPLATLPPDRVEFVRWSPAIEVTALQDLTVGIIPLEDSDWARGKCSFKMLTYMACGVPVVASNVGMNADVFAHGPCGFPASTPADWVDALTMLLGYPQMRANAGAVGRSIVETEYSTERVAGTLAAALKEVAGVTARA